MSLEGLKMKKQGLNFLKAMNKKYYTIHHISGFKRLAGLFAVLLILELENSWFRFFDVTNRLNVTFVYSTASYLDLDTTSQVSLVDLQHQRPSVDRNSVMLLPTPHLQPAPYGDLSNT